MPLIDFSDPLLGGGTEFVVASHKMNFTASGVTDTDKLKIWAEQQEKITPPVSMGDALLFHGNTLHRGAPSSLAERPILYYVFKKSFYSDEDAAEYIELDDDVDNISAQNIIDDINGTGRL